MDAFKLQEPLPRPPVGPLKMLQVGTDEQQAPAVIRMRTYWRSVITRQ